MPVPGSLAALATRHRSGPTAALALTLALALALAGCGAPDAPGDAGASGFADPQWTLGEPDLRIGSVDDAAYAFTAVGDLEVLPSGEILTLHPREQQIRRWSPSGEAAGVIGRRGEGPGEFASVRSFGLFGDTIWSWDFNGPRVSRFSLDGELLGTERAAIPTGRAADEFPPYPAAVFRDGRVLASPQPYSQAIVNGALTHSVHVVTDPDGTVRDTLWVQEWNRLDNLAIIREDGETYGPQPFGDMPLFSVVDDGLVILDRRTPDAGAVQAAVAVTRIDLQGDTLRRIELPYDPVPLQEAAIDSAAQATADQLYAFLSQARAELAIGDLIEAVREGMYEPPFRPHVAQMLVHADGSIWLRLHEPAADGDFRWWIVDPDGAPAGTVTTPADLRILKVVGGSVYGVETDDLGVNYVVRIPLMEAGGG